MDIGIAKAIRARYATNAGMLKREMALRMRLHTEHGYCVIRQPVCVIQCT